MTTFNVDARNHISVTAKARIAKFCVQVGLEYINCYPWDDKLPNNGRGQGHVTRFLNFGSRSYLCWNRWSWVLQISCAKSEGHRVHAW